MPATSCSAFAELAEKALPLLGFVVSNSPRFSELVAQAVLQLGKHVGAILHLLQLPEQVSVLSRNLLLVSFDIVEVEVGLLNLLGLLVEGVEQVLVRLLSGGLRSSNLINSSTGVGDLVNDVGLVLLHLGLHLGELLDLLAHLGDRVLVLLFQADQGGFLLDVSLLQVAAKFGYLSLALLVELNLGGGGSGGLSQPLAHVLADASQVSPLPLSLGTCLPLCLELLFHLLNSRLVFLDSLLNLCNKRLLIVELRQKSS